MALFWYSKLEVERGVRIMRKYILCILILALIATIGHVTKAVGQAGDYFIGKDEDGLYISTDQHGKFTIEGVASIKPGTQGIYFIKKNKSGNYISTDKLGNFYIEPERISKKEARESARQKAEWNEMWEETARRDTRVTKARRLKEARDRDEEIREEAAAAREEAEREFELEKLEKQRPIIIAPAPPPIIVPAPIIIIP